MASMVHPASTTSAVLSDVETVNWELFRQSFESSCTIISRYRSLRSASGDENHQRLVTSIATSSREFLGAVGESTIAAEDTNMICSDVLRYLDLKREDKLSDEKFGGAVEHSANIACANSTLIHTKFRSVRQKLFEVTEDLPNQRAIAAGGQDTVVLDDDQQISVELSVVKGELEEALNHAMTMLQIVDGLVKWWQHVKMLAKNLREGPSTDANLPEELREILSRQKWEKLRDASSHYIFQIHSFSDQNELGFPETLSSLPTPIEEERSQFRSRVWSISGQPMRLIPDTRPIAPNALTLKTSQDGTQPRGNEDNRDRRQSIRNMFIRKHSTSISTTGKTEVSIIGAKSQQESTASKDKKPKTIGCFDCGCTIM